MGSTEPSRLPSEARLQSRAKRGMRQGGIRSRVPSSLSFAWTRDPASRSRLWAGHRSGFRIPTRGAVVSPIGGDSVTSSKLTVVRLDSRPRLAVPPVGGTSLRLSNPHAGHAGGPLPLLE